MCTFKHFPGSVFYLVCEVLTLLCVVKVPSLLLYTPFSSLMFRDVPFIFSLHLCVLLMLFPFCFIEEMEMEPFYTFLRVSFGNENHFLLGLLLNHSQSNFFP